MTSQPKASRYILYGQCYLYLGLGVCILLKPHGLIANDGISYYGIFLKTVTPYAIGIAGSSYCMWCFAFMLDSGMTRFIRFSVAALLPLSLIIIATPYSVSTLSDWIHTITGSVIFILQLCISGWMVIKYSHTRKNLGLWLLQLLGGIISAIYVHAPHGYLIEGQLLFQVAFGVFLYQNVGHVAFSSLPKTPKQPATLEA